MFPSNPKTVRLSCKAWTCKVVIDDSPPYVTVVDAAPLLARFIGQPYANLLRWARKKFGDVQADDLEDGKWRLPPHRVERVLSPEQLATEAKPDGRSVDPSAG